MCRWELVIAIRLRYLMGLRELTRNRCGANLGSWGQYLEYRAYPGNKKGHR